MSRPVTKEKEAKKGIDQLIKAMDEADKKGDVNAAADLVDFPAMLITDDSKGTTVIQNVSREQFIAMMKPFMGPKPKDMKMTMKHDIVLLSDTLGYVIGDMSLTMGKTKGSFKSVSMVVQKDGRWKVKSMAEAGWGDMMQQAPGGKAPPATRPSK